MRTLVSAASLLIGALVLLVTCHGQQQEEKLNSFFDFAVQDHEVQALIARLEAESPPTRIPRNLAADALELRAKPYIDDLRLSKVVDKGQFDVTSRVGRAGELAVGDTATVEFDVNRDGFISIWSRDADGVLSRIVPNKFMNTAARAVRVRASARYRVGVGGLFENGKQSQSQDGWALKVTKPIGTAEVLLVWSEDEKSHSSSNAFPDLDAYAATRRGARDTVDLPLKYTVVD